VIGAPMSGGAEVVVTDEAVEPLRRGVVVVGDADDTGVVVAVVLDVVVVVAFAVVVVALAVVVVAVAVVVVVVAVTARQVGEVIVLSSSVTAPLRAKARPWRVAPVFIVIDASASMLPTKADVVPMVAEEPTCQYTLQAWTPPERTTLLPGAAVNVLTAWKMNTELASPTSVTEPVSDIDELAE
jgi:hypothetical protein